MFTPRFLYIKYVHQVQKPWLVIVVKIIYKEKGKSLNQNKSSRIEGINCNIVIDCYNEL